MTNLYQIPVYKPLHSLHICHLSHAEPRVINFTPHVNFGYFITTGRQIIPIQWLVTGTRTYRFIEL